MHSPKQIDTMPVEDASVPWPEDESPYLSLARLTVARQPAWNEERAEWIDDGLSFSPWHGVTAHQPLGSKPDAASPLATGAMFGAGFYALAYGVTTALVADRVAQRI